MQEQNIQSYLSSLSNQDLVKRTNDCFNDLKTISESDPNSVEHEQCFAAMHYFTNEMQSRNLSLQ